MTTIKAPYNFVPLSDKIFYPDWSELVSYDIPFSDGESGEIEIELTAKSDIYVRNGHTQHDQEIQNEDYISFSKGPDGSYFIPGTSIKGSIRNVLEIMSFGKINPDKNMRFATREWDNPLIYHIKDVKVQNTIHCGYLFLDDREAKIEDHGKPFRINHRRIDEFLNTDVFSIFSEKSDLDINKAEEIKDHLDLDRKTARFKFWLLKSKNISTDALRNLRFSIDEEYQTSTSNRLKFDASGNIRGDIVLTGQPSKWSSSDKKQREKDKGKGKFYEFVFPAQMKGYVKIKEDLLNQYLYFLADSEDWQYWKPKFYKGEKVPVFFRYNENKELLDFGLAFMYKQVFQYSVKDLVENHQKESLQDKPDLAETIFGTLNGNSGSFKGRVQFGHFKVLDTPMSGKIEKTTLGSPKASYYPIYVRQQGEQNRVPKKTLYRKSFPDYNTYDEPDSVISGWKRYPVRGSATPQETGNKNLDTKFIPLKTGTRFTGKIRFHNLRKTEIGALLSALTFHGNQDKLNHSMGMGKPQGYGKIAVKIKNIKLKYEPEEYLAAFEETMDKYLGKERWHQSLQVKELMSMAYEPLSKKPGVQLRYMHMDNNREKNEFLKAKQFGEYLSNYTALADESFPSGSILDSFEQKKLEERKKRLQSTDEKITQLIEKASSNFKELNFVEAFQIVAEIEKLGKGNWDLLTKREKFATLKKSADSYKEINSLLNEVKTLKGKKNWTEAKVLLIQKIKPLAEANNKLSEKIDAEIEFCRKMESENANLSNAIDKSKPLEENKGKINNYLNKKGKLKRLPEEDFDEFAELLIEWRKMDPKGDDKKWTDFDFKRSIWKLLIVKWLDRDDALKIFHKVIKG